MKCFLALMLFAFTGYTARSQWYWQQNPLHEKDFLKVATNKYTAAFEYEITANEKTLNGVLEFGTLGLPIALYRKGTNDNGDSINTEEVTYRFDGIGRLVRQTTIDKIEGSEWSNVYIYTKGNQLLKTTTLSIDPATTLYSYDAKGKLTKTYTTVRMAALDKKGNPTGKRIDKPHERASFVYDAKGRLREKWVYNLSSPDRIGKPSFKMVFTFNEKGQLEKLERVNEEGNVYNTESYEYDNDGLLKKATTKAEGEQEKVFVYEYCTACTLNNK